MGNRQYAIYNGLTFDELRLDFFHVASRSLKVQAPTMGHRHAMVPQAHNVGLAWAHAPYGYW